MVAEPSEQRGSCIKHSTKKQKNLVRKIGKNEA